MGMSDKLGIGKCCCGCTIAEDAYESVDAISVAWTGDTGDFTKSGGQVTTTSANKMIRHSSANPDADYEFTLRCKLKGSNAADKVRLVGSWYDADNYIYIEIATAATTTMKLYQRKAATDTQIGVTRTITGKTTGDWILVRMCVYNDSAYAEALTTSGSTVTSGAISTGAPYNRGAYAGVATDSLSGTATFDDFLFEKNRDDDAACPQCNACDNQGFSDAFSDAEFGWSDAYVKYTLNAGRMRASDNGFPQNYRCSVRPTLSVGSVLEVTATVYGPNPIAGYAGVGVMLNTSPGGFGLTSVLLLAEFTAAPKFSKDIGNGFTMDSLGGTPADGDTLTIRATCTQASPQLWDVDWIVNGSTLGTDTGLSLAIPDPFYYGIWLSMGAGAGHYVEWDDFEMSAG